MLTLSILKTELYVEYNSSNPVLYRVEGNSITESDFLGKIFPKKFYCDTILNEKTQETYSLEKLLTKRNGGTAQRNRIFNRNYIGFTLAKNVAGILSAKPELWEEICLRCKWEIDKAGDLSAFKEYIHSFIKCEGKSMNDTFSAHLLSSLEKEPGNSLAEMILYLLLDGKVNDLMPLLESTESFVKQFSYMEPSSKMLKRTFGDSLSTSHFNDILTNYYNDYSELLSYVTTIEANGEIIEYTDLLDTLYSLLQTSSGKKLIYISGPGGTEKNAITQLLYLRIACDVRSGNNTKFAPYYVNLNYYSEIWFTCRDDATKQLEIDFRDFQKYCNEHCGRTPIVFVDGLKNYDFDDSGIDYKLNQLIEELSNVELVIAAENGVITNRARQRITPPFAAGIFTYRVTLDSIYLFDTAVAKSYLNKFCQLYRISTSRNIFERLKALGVQRVDTYQLRLMLGRLWEAKDIADLYEKICIDFLNGNHRDLSVAEQWAFDFSYTAKKVYEMPQISRELRQLLSAHGSILEYFIARWYLTKIQEGTMQNSIAALDMVMPKGVTRFIVPMLNTDAGRESAVLDLIEENYAEMGLMAKSEMTYWLGRIKSPSMAERAERILEQLYQEQLLSSKKAKPSDPDYKQILFLLRGISVSLIVKGHMDVSDEYIESLINNKLANEINRGFHLEYYGDKAYIPIYDTLDFMDDISKGRRTLDQLIGANEFTISGNARLPVFELNLFTICSLLQARVEYKATSSRLDLQHYISKALEQIDWYLYKTSSGSRVFREYLEMVYKDFEKRLSTSPVCWSSIGSETYTLYSKRIDRTGWVKHGITFPESVAEHMYHTWMMGLMFLPDTYTKDPSYSKEKILHLLLLHDIAEATTGDIPKPEKAKKRSYFDAQESKEMGIFLLHGSYPGLAALTESYKTWQLWNSPNDINGKVARDMDIIQTMFKLLSYINDYPDNFPSEDVQPWLNERNDIRTPLGQRVYRTVILENLDFESILKKYNIIKE